MKDGYAENLQKIVYFMTWHKKNKENHEEALFIFRGIKNKQVCFIMAGNTVERKVKIKRIDMAANYPIGL